MPHLVSLVLVLASSVRPLLHFFRPPCVRFSCPHLKSFLEQGVALRVANEHPTPTALRQRGAASSSPSQVFCQPPPPFAGSALRRGSLSASIATTAPRTWTQYPDVSVASESGCRSGGVARGEGEEKEDRWRILVPISAISRSSSGEGVLVRADVLPHFPCALTSPTVNYARSPALVLVLCTLSSLPRLCRRRRRRSMSCRLHLLCHTRLLRVYRGAWESRSLRLSYSLFFSCWLRPHLTVAPPSPLQSPLSMFEVGGGPGPSFKLPSCESFRVT